mmetsp:Transcript_41008/g.123761  ORF Transcript_41008/g.123761 Transcript_41008/m.123761 type:complete len:266 (-) Transcript_41008:160-957(-)
MLRLLLPVVTPPLLHPLIHTIDVALHLLDRIRPHLVNDLPFVRFPRLVQYHLHNLALQILPPFLVRVSPLGQSIVQNVGPGAQYQDEIEPPFGEKIAPVIIDDGALPGRGGGAEHLLHEIEQLVLVVVVEDVRIELSVLARVELVTLDEIADVDVLHAEAFRDERRRGRLSDARRARHQDVRPRPLRRFSLRVAHGYALEIIYNLLGDRGRRAGGVLDGEKKKRKGREGRHSRGKRFETLGFSCNLGGGHLFVGALSVEWYRGCG